MDCYHEKLIVYNRSLDFIEFTTELFESNTFGISMYGQLD